ncbi:hypothetical protein F5148DRAFT_1146310 [Russula earlei]|uniref:Uncharacterized protein n=1 Tax=Russula earlei TaxID=71964 RepID=A0ACC0UKU0_9AGAM|nr:hypothetical protein F5148DRAFT_1146310 [Russula earlei]
MRSSVFVIFCLAVNIAPSFALPLRERNPGSDQLEGAQPSSSGLNGVARGGLPSLNDPVGGKRWDSEEPRLQRRGGLSFPPTPPPVKQSPAHFEDPDKLTGNDKARYDRARARIQNVEDSPVVARDRTQRKTEELRNLWRL